MPTSIGSIANEAHYEKEALESGWQINLQSRDEELTYLVRRYWSPRISHSKVSLQA